MKEFTQNMSNEVGEDFGDVVKSYSNRVFDFEMSPKSAMHILDKRI